MPIIRDTPYLGMNFLVDLGNGETEGPGAAVMQLLLPEARVDMLEYREGGEKVTNARKAPAQSRYTPLILRRGYAGSLDWYQWWNQLRNGDMKAQRTVTVQLVTEDRSAVVTTWRFTNARAAAWHVANFDALHPQTLIETLEISVERMTVE